MSAKQFTLAVVGMFLVLGFGYVSAGDLVKRKDRVEFQKVELKSDSTRIKELDLQYQLHNKELEKANQQQTQSAEELEKIRLQKEQLEQQKKDLEAQLQAKIEQKTKLAQASERAVNAVTMTGTASAASGGGDLRSIVRAAAIKNGLDPDWFWGLAKCESTWNPNAVNYDYYDNGHPSGLFQHISGYWPARAAQYGYPGASVFDPVANANVTAAMWKGGSHLWECQ